MFIFSGVEHSAAELAAMSPAELTAYRVSEAQMVQMPYLTLAGIVICIGIAIALVRLPRISHDRASAGTLPGLRSVLREPALAGARSDEHTSELQSLMSISYAVFCLKKKK